MYEQKKLMRKICLEERSRLSKAEVKSKSESIFDKLYGLEQFVKSRLIFCYIDFNNEVETKDFIQRCLAMEKRIVVPLITSTAEGRKEMLASEITNLDTDLEKGTFGILEPKKGRIHLIKSVDIDLVVAPGIGFDLKRNRLGYGAGYYDRYLKKVRMDCSKVGVAFDLQIMEEVPTGRYDVPLDMIITESRII